MHYQTSIAQLAAEALMRVSVNEAGFNRLKLNKSAESILGQVHETALPHCRVDECCTYYIVLKYISVWR